MHSASSVISPWLTYPGRPTYLLNSKNTAEKIKKTQSSATEIQPTPCSVVSGKWRNQLANPPSWLQTCWSLEEIVLL